MQKIVLKEAKEKFLKARELCPTMKKEMYLVTDYIGTRVGDEITPLDLMYQMLDVMTHLVGAGSVESQDVFSLRCLLEMLLSFSEVWKQLPEFPSVVDTIADEKFAEVFRATWVACSMDDTFKRIQPRKKEL